MRQRKRKKASDVVLRRTSLILYIVGKLENGGKGSGEQCFKLGMGSPLNSMRDAI